MRRLPHHCSRIVLTVCASIAAATGSCMTTSADSSTRASSQAPDSDAMKTQSLVMAMADDYIAELREARHAIKMEDLTPHARALAQEFHRNGVSASLTIGSGPNPAAAMLDMLVLGELRVWAMENHWMPAGIGEAGRPALERMKKAREDLWARARKVLTPEQEATVREIVQAWIEQHPDRMVVSMVRFDEFAQERMISSASLRKKAVGLLSEVSEAKGAIEDVRLYGERMRWFVGRYPILLGAQVEDTTYRLLEQPEALEAMRAIDSVQNLSDSFDKRLDDVRSDVHTEMGEFFTNVRAERAAAIDQFFAGLASQRTALLDDLESRQGNLVGVMKELRDTITASKQLTTDMTGTVDAIDRVVARFQADPNLMREPLRMEDVRDAAIESGKAAQEMTRVLQMTNELLESQALRTRMDELVNPAGRIIDRSFWRGAALVGLLVVGLGLLKLVPQRVSRPATAGA